MSSVCLFFFHICRSRWILLLLTVTTDWFHWISSTIITSLGESENKRLGHRAMFLRWSPLQSLYLCKSEIKTVGKVAGIRMNESLTEFIWNIRRQSTWRIWYCCYWYFSKHIWRIELDLFLFFFSFSWCERGVDRVTNLRHLSLFLRQCHG